MTLAERVAAAEARIRPHIRETPLLRSPGLSARTGAEIWLKLENLQITGSFKLRGALNKILLLSAEDKARGVVTASTGNHGAATAYAGRLAGVVPTVFVPHGAVPSKVERIKALGARVEFSGHDSADTERHARAESDRTGQVFVSPYNDWDVVAGQGTIGLELLRQCPGLDAAVIAVGGGGLIGGIAGYLKAVRASIEVIGCQPEASAVMAKSVAAGRILDLPSGPTLSDGTAGGVEDDTITFDLCREAVDRYDLVDEPAIEEGVRLAFLEEGLVVEGAAGLAVASALRQAPALVGRSIAVVLCGGNIGVETWCGLMRGR
jgi:threonine dehydratase